MFDKEKKKKPTPFEFDLEKELKTDLTRAKAMLGSIDAKLQEVKNKLRQGCSKEDYEEYGHILKGYTSLQRVLTRIMKK